MPGMYRVYAIYISPAFWIFGVRQPRLEKVVCCFPRINLLDSCVLILEQKKNRYKHCRYFKIGSKGGYHLG